MSILQSASVIRFLLAGSIVLAHSAYATDNIAHFKAVGPGGYGEMPAPQIRLLETILYDSGLLGPTLLAPASTAVFSLSGTTSDPFAAPGTAAAFVLVDAPDIKDAFGNLLKVPRKFVAELSKGSPAGSILYAGILEVGKSAPQASEILCKAAVDTAGVAQCLLNAVPGIGEKYWLLVQTNSADAAVEVSYAPIYKATSASVLADVVATGPGSIIVRSLPDSSADTTRVSWSNLRLQPNQIYYGAVDYYYDNTSRLVSQFFTLTREVGGNDVNIAMPAPVGDNETTRMQSVLLAPGEATSRWFFDLPPITDGSQYGEISFFHTTDAADAHAIDFALVRSDFPAQNASSQIDPAPSIDNAIYKSGLGAGGSLFLSGLSPGRWYFVAKNVSAAPARFSIAIKNGINGGEVICPPCGPGTPHIGAGANPTIAPGFYYNHLRSGHGISLSQASGQQVVFWYSYLEDGTPQWYQAQAAAPDAKSGWWHAPLYRVAWDGAKAHLTAVGDVTLTPVATNEFMFTWSLDGMSGSERFSQLARTGACPIVDWAQTNFNGAWYAPTLSGYGLDVLALPEQQFDILYFYDDAGLARWGVGSSLPFAASSTLAFNQNAGFCPSCAWSKVTSQPLGAVNIDYSSPSSGNLSTSLTLQPPLSGSWITNKPMVRLTGSSTCTQ